MKNIFKLFFAISITALFITSCNEEVAFDAITSGFDASVEPSLVFLNGNMLYEVENNATGDETVKIQLQVWGPPSSADATVTIAVDGSSTAVSGKHYNLSSTTVNIPANSGGGSFNVIMHTDKFAKGDTVKLVMNMTTTGFKTDLYASTANLLLSKKPECPFSIKTFTGNYIADETGYGKYNVDFKADDTDPHRTWQSNFWDYTSDLLAFDLDPETNTITVPEQTITMGDGKGYLVVGSGTFDPCTGVMIVDFQGDVDGTHEVYTPGSVQ